LSLLVIACLALLQLAPNLRVPNLHAYRTSFGGGTAHLNESQTTKVKVSASAISRPPVDKSSLEGADNDIIKALPVERSMAGSVASYDVNRIESQHALEQRVANAEQKSNHLTERTDEVSATYQLHSLLFTGYPAMHCSSKYV
jgi:phage-related protein